MLTIAWHLVAEQDDHHMSDVLGQEQKDLAALSQSWHQVQEAQAHESP